MSLNSDTNLKVVNFLDLTINLSTGKYESYNKPDNKPLYINVNSNHPPNIIKNLPESISRRINKLSSDKTVFNNSKELLNNTLSNTRRVKTSCPLDGNCLQSSLVYICKAATPKITNNYPQIVKADCISIKNHLVMKTRKTQLNYPILYGRTNMQIQKHLR